MLTDGDLAVWAAGLDDLSGWWRVVGSDADVPARRAARTSPEAAGEQGAALSACERAAAALEAASRAQDMGAVSRVIAEGQLLARPDRVSSPACARWRMTGPWSATSMRASPRRTGPVTAWTWIASVVRCLRGTRSTDFPAGRAGGLVMPLAGGAAGGPILKHSVALRCGSCLDKVPYLPCKLLWDGRELPRRRPLDRLREKP